MMCATICNDCGKTLIWFDYDDPQPQCVHDRPEHLIEEWKESRKEE